MTVILWPIEHFNVLSGDPPEVFRVEFQRITQRARHLLKQHSQDDVECALDLVGWLIAHEDIVAEQFNQLAEGSTNATRQYSAEVESLLIARRLVSLDNQTLLPGATWPELFAALALGFVAMASERFHVLSEVKTLPRGDYVYSDTLGYFAIEAMEAVGVAESLHDLASYSADIEHRKNIEREKISLQKQDAAFERHRKTTQLLRELRAFYEAGSFKTYANAVQAFLATIPQERVHHLVPTNRQRTLTEGLSAVLRGKRQL